MRRSILSILAIAALVVAVFPSPSIAAIGNEQSPKLINFFLGYEIKTEDPAKLAKWDIVVLDMDQSFQFPDRVREIKRINPNIKLLAYVSSSEIAQARYGGDSRSPGRRLASRIPEAWFLTRASGARASWWPGAYLLNASTLAPSVNGQTWRTFLGPFIRDEIMSTGLWDGVFLDAAYENVTQHFGNDLDPDRNGKANTPAEINSTYRTGMRELITNVRNAIGKDKIIINNSSAVYADISNGVLYENFPRYGFAGPFAELRTTLGKNPEPKVSAINTNTNNRENPNDFRLMRYGLTSALVADSFYSFDAGDSGHHRTWWYDEYEAPIGNARNAPRNIKKDVWSREYQRGIAIVNATKQVEQITLPGEFEKIRGSQDPRINDGSIVTRVTVPAEDGLVLIRRSEATQVVGASVPNGAFLQVFDATGRRLRNGFFAQRDDVPGGANFLATDLDRNGSEDLVFANAGEVTVRLDGATDVRFRPFGANYRGAISIAAGQTDGDAPWELVLAPDGNSTPTVQITDLRGRVRKSWLAYESRFRGGVSIAVGDVNGDNLREIFTGTGTGGGPHVRSFKTDGVAWRGGFFAFAASERAGVRVAIGDIDGDGRDDLVAGSGIGAAPKVRVYDADGRLRSEFTPAGITAAQGVRPVLSDIDGDGKREILIPGSAF
jgi:hypothetical protein